MERPSHSISTLLSQSPTRRVGGLSVAVIAQLSFAAVLIGGIVDRIVKEAPPPPLVVTKVDENNRLPPPPPIKAQKVEVPTAAMPLIDIAPDSSGTPITVVPPQPPQPPPVQLTRPPPPTPAAVPDRAAAAIPETHTVPPYPTLARRLGVEGKVTLRLSVQADGTVDPGGGGHLQRPPGPRPGGHPVDHEPLDLQAGDPGWRPRRHPGPGGGPVQPFRQSIRF